MGLGVLCLETYWSPDRDDRRTVRGLLELLEHNVAGLVAVHRHVANRADFEWYMEHEWAVDQRYDVLYIAAHGDAGAVMDENGSYMPMQWLGRRLNRSSAGRVVFLAGCGTLDVTDRRLRTFAKSTQASAVAGYARSVDWLEAAQMDLIVLGALAKRGPGATGVWARAPSTTLETLYEEHRRFADRLEWQFTASDDAAWQAPRRALPDGAASAIGQLSAIARDASVDVAARERAIEALAALRERSALTTFTALARDSRVPTSLRRTAVRGLGEIPGKVSVQSLRQLEQRLREAAGDPDAVALVELVTATLQSRAA